MSKTEEMLEQLSEQYEYMSFETSRSFSHLEWLNGKDLTRRFISHNKENQTVRFTILSDESFLLYDATFNEQDFKNKEDILYCSDGGYVYTNIHRRNR